VRLRSACLLGVQCTYDDDTNVSADVLALLRNEILIPVCPEQWGGLLTPREGSELMGDGADVLDGEAQVVSESGKDVTANFIKGAQEVLKLAKLLGIKKAILKQESPSCGCGRVCRGPVDGVAEWDGVVAALLKRNGIAVMLEEDVTDA